MYTRRPNREARLESKSHNVASSATGSMFVSFECEQLSKLQSPNQSHLFRMFLYIQFLIHILVHSHIVDHGRIHHFPFQIFLH